MTGTFALAPHSAAAETSTSDMSSRMGMNSPIVRMQAPSFGRTSTVEDEPILRPLLAVRDTLLCRMCGLHGLPKEPIGSPILRAGSSCLSENPIALLEELPLRV